MDLPPVSEVMKWVLYPIVTGGNGDGKLKIMSLPSQCERTFTVIGTVAVQRDHRPQMLKGAGKSVCVSYGDVLKLSFSVQKEGK